MTPDEARDYLVAHGKVTEGEWNLLGESGQHMLTQATAMYLRTQEMTPEERQEVFDQFDAFTEALREVVETIHTAIESIADEIVATDPRRMEVVVSVDLTDDETGHLVKGRPRISLN